MRSYLRNCVPHMRTAGQVLGDFGCTVRSLTEYDRRPEGNPSPGCKQPAGLFCLLRNLTVDHIPCVMNFHYILFNHLGKVLRRGRGQGLHELLLRHLWVGKPLLNIVHAPKDTRACHVCSGPVHCALRAKRPRSHIWTEGYWRKVSIAPQAIPVSKASASENPVYEALHLWCTRPVWLEPLILTPLVVYENAVCMA